MIESIQITQKYNNRSNKISISPGAKRVAMHALQEAAKCPHSSMANMRKKYAFQVATLDLFSQWASHIDWGKKKIVLSAYVLSDGFGDYFNMLTQAENLQKKHPDLQIFLLIEFLDFAKRSSHLELPNPKHFSYAFIEGSKVHTCHSKGQGIIDTPQFWIREEIENADWVLQVSFLKKRPQALLGYEPIFGLQENGLFSRRKNISIETLGMGVGKFDLGLNFPLNPTEYKLINDRAENKQFHFGYFSGQDLDFQRVMFLITSISLARKDQAIAFNFCCQELSEFLQEESIKTLLGKLGVKEVLVNDKEAIVCGLQGRSVEVFNPFPLTRQDFATFVQKAQGLIGCTGDVSFSQAVQAGIPFYQVRDIKIPFVEDLICFASEILTKEEASSVKLYFEWLIAMHDVEDEFPLRSLFSEKPLFISALNKLIMQSQKVLCPSVFCALKIFFAKLKEKDVFPYVDALLCQTLVFNTYEKVHKLYGDYLKRIEQASIQTCTQLIQDFQQAMAKLEKLL